MGRGVAWNDVEASELARAWIGASEDPIIGIHQTSQMFFNKMFQPFRRSASEGANSKTYGGSGLRATRANWESVSTDCQMFRHIHACQPTGVTEGQIMSIAVAKHLGKRDGMDCDAKDYVHEHWINHLAFKVLRHIQNFSDDTNNQEVPDAEDEGEVINNNPFVPHSATSPPDSASPRRMATPASSTASKTEEETNDSLSDSQRSVPLCGNDDDMTMSPNYTGGSQNEGRSRDGGYVGSKKAKREQRMDTYQ